MTKKAAVALFIGLTCIGTVPAFAGYWEVIPNSEENPNPIVEGVVKKSSNYIQNGNFVPYTIQAQWGVDEEPEFDRWSVYIDGPQYVYAESSGTTNLGFRWIPDNSNDNPPAVLHVKIHAGLQASAFTGVNEANDMEFNFNLSALGENSTANPTWFDDGEAAGYRLPFSKTVLRTLKTNAQGEAWTGPIPTSSKVNVLGTNSSGWFFVIGTAGISVSVQQDARSVKIVSPTIEDSYYYASEFTLPLINNPEFRPGTPTPPAAGPYAVKHKRADDGSMTVDSVAKWVGTLGPGNDSNYGSGLFIAQIPGYQRGITTWTVSGGTPHGDIEGDTLTSDTNNDGYVSLDNHYNLLEHDVVAGAYLHHGIDLGGQEGGNGIVSQTVIKAEVKDTADNAIGSNTFTINWNKEYENWRDDPARETEVDYPINDAASSWVIIGDPITVTVKPANFAWNIAGTGTGLASVVTGGVALFLAPEVAIPVGVGAAGLAAANIVITDVAPEDEIWSTTFSYDKYADAITRQYNKNQLVPGTENNRDCVFPIEFADAAIAELVDPEDPNTSIFQDKFWAQAASLQVMGKIAYTRARTFKPRTVDLFDIKGYAGPYPHDYRLEGAVTYVNQVKIFTAPPW